LFLKKMVIIRVMLTANYFIIPFVSGLIGFFTNAIAIKMLFRPHKAKWYTLWWQGIIPRTRKVLALKISALVGQKLVTEREITRALKAPQFSEKFYDLTLSAFNRLTFQTYQEELAAALFSDRQISAILDKLSDSLNGFIKEKIYSLTLKEVSELVSHADFLDTSKLRQAAAEAVGKKVAEELHNIFSLESIAELFSEAFGGTLPLKKVADTVIEGVVPAVSGLFSDENVINEVSGVIIEFLKEENLFTAAGAKVFKGKIKRETARKLPAIGEKISRSRVIRRKLTDTAEGKLSELARTKIRILMGSEFYPFLQTAPHIAARRFLSEGVTSEAVRAIRACSSPEDSIGEFLKKSDIELPALPLKKLFRDNFGKLLNAVLSAELAEALTRKVTSDAFAGQISRTFVNTVDIGKEVEDKINSLDTAEVEEMIFSFTRTHFKWINLLGFAIGFLVGVVQVLFAVCA
jgi:uncharacterized membrane protein YheB (UPF0754 family)